ncbi:MAG: hypothetical protein IPJ34_42100 [Myxococcales bacterium]|nr:hypothetical protein [Myxococcales bacterium]
MASPTVDAIKEQLDEISGSYAARFAGHSRVTRDVAEMDDLVRRTEAVVRQLADLPKTALDSTVAELATQAKESLELYRNERIAIAEAKKGGGDVEEFAALGVSANAVFARWRRHFAGQSRATRDLGLLSEMIDDLTKINTRMVAISSKRKAEGMQDDLDLVSNNIKLYVGERQEITKAREDATKEELGDIMAEVANSQFKVYQDHFAGMSRLTRRPQLLQRLVSNLEQAREKMKQLRSNGLKTETNDNNIQIVEDNLRMYSTELTEIKKARATVKLVDLMNNLGGAANDVMTEYRENYAGKARKGRDLDRLSKLCDQMGEIVRQMRDLGRAEVQEFNVRNAQICSDNLSMLDNEWAEIQKANEPS